MSSLSARMKKIQSKMKALDCSQDIPDYNPMGATRCHGNPSSNPTWHILSPTPMMIQLKFDYDRPTGWGDIHF